ncbi:phage tail protein [Oceanobacillus massiliensis]|uniref:phage tail protein n=1 Tax=Oceanobacillus massiliensis TaxID=1465765 RepID=UPI00301A4A18
MSLHKPSGEQVGNLVDAYNRDGAFKFGQFNEISFTIPKYVERKNKKEINKNYAKIRERFLVKATYGDLIDEMLIVTGITKVKGNIPEKEITLKSRQFELNSKIIRLFETGSVNVNSAINQALRNSGWSLNHIDAELLSRRRTFEENKITVLNTLYKIAETYGGILQFDTFNKTVSLYKPESLERDLGLNARYGKYTIDASEESDAETVITRLYVYGKDDLSIDSINPTGAEYIEDFSYFMQGYETDNEGNVISSSPYMSDGLCQAIIDFSTLVESKDIEYNNLTSKRQPYIDQMTVLNEEMATLQEEYESLLDDLDNARANEEPTNDLKQQRDSKQAKINNKQSEIDTVQSSVDLINADIEVIYEELSLENNFTPEEIDEREAYILEDLFEDARYTVIEELFQAGKDSLTVNNSPKRDVSFSLVQFLQIVEAQKDWDKLGLGYVIRMNYEPLDIQFKALITEFSIGFDEKSLDLTVSNVTYKNPQKQLADMLYSSAVSTSNKLDANSSKWNESSNKTTQIEAMLQNDHDATKQKIVAGSDESVTVDGRGIKIRNPKYPDDVLVIQSGVIALSNNNAEDWDTAIDANGVRANKVVGRLLAGENLIIENEGGSFLVTADGVDIVNGNLAIMNNDGNSRVIINPVDGIRIQRKEGEAFIDSFFADEIGNLHISGTLNMNGGTIDWNNVEKPTYTVEDLDALPADSPIISKLSSTGQYTGSITVGQVENALSTDSTILNYLNQYGIYTGDIETSQIKSGSLEGKTFSNGTFNNPNLQFSMTGYLMSLFDNQFEIKDTTNNITTLVKAGNISISDSNDLLEIKPNGIYKNGNLVL